MATMMAHTPIQGTNLSCTRLMIVPSALTAAYIREGCKEEQCQHIVSIGRMKTFDRDEAIFREHEPTDYVYLVVSGVIRGCKVLADGRRLVSRFFFPGQLMGYDQDAEASITTDATTSATVCAVPKRDWDRSIREDSDLQGLPIKAIVSELEKTRTHVLALGRLTATERVAQFLYSLVQNMEQDEDGATHIPVGRLDISDHLGLTIETTSRVFSSLKQNDLIKLLDKYRFIILDECAIAAEFLEQEI